MTNSQLNQDIRVNLLNISRIIHKAGDNELGHLLDRIIRFPDQIGALHKALSKRLKPRTSKKAQEIESALKKRRDWFRTFVSRGGERLKNKDIEELARITKGWELSESQVNALLVCSTLWASYPGLFWRGGPPDQNILRSCFNDLERMCEVDPLRRRILLMTLSNQVQQFQRALHGKSKAGARAQKQKTSSKRERGFLPAALCSMTTELWPSVSPENQERIKDKLQSYSRAGWKWQQLAHKWLSLSFQDSTVRGFERRSWTLIEIEAMNLFTETLPQYRIRSFLEKAFDSIVIDYSGVSSPRHDQFNNTHGNVRDSNITTNNRVLQPTAAISAGHSLEDSEVSQTSPATVVLQSLNCTPLWESGLSHEASDVTMPRGPLFDDTQAASILSSISRNSPAWQSHQGMSALNEAGDPSPIKPTDPLTPVNQENTSTSYPFSPNVAARNIPHCSAQAVAEPGGVLQLQQCPPPQAPVAQTSVEWAQPSMEPTRSILRQDNSVFELANPFSPWQPGSYDDLDWGAALREITLGDHSRYGNFPDSSSNPFPLCDSMDAFALLELDLLTSADRLTFGEDDATISSVSR